MMTWRSNHGNCVLDLSRQNSFASLDSCSSGQLSGEERELVEVDGVACFREIDERLVGHTYVTEVNGQHIRRYIRAMDLPAVDFTNSY